MGRSSFDISPETAVVTSIYVTRDKQPILYVSHVFDEEEGLIWQFHAGGRNFDMKNMQLVRLDTILRIDPSIAEVADLPVGFKATRAAKGEPWVFEKEEEPTE